MLMARRDPPFHADAHNAASTDFAAYPPPPVHRFIRFTTAMQLLGSLVAVPVGLASAYSLYHATFSVEASCQSLRAGIVAMLDKSVDATTRRMLVRRDVVTFEQNCGKVDPDATTAFKTLLATEKTAAVSPAKTPISVAAPAVPKAQNSETLPKEPVRKAEPRPQPAAKQPVAAAAEPVRRDPAASDAQWVDAVRQALLTHHAEPVQIDHTKAPAMPASTLRPAQQEIVLPPSLPSSLPASVAAPTSAPPAPAPLAAPTVPAATMPAPTPVVQADADHPVPPAAIPDAANAAKPDEQGHSRVRRWIAKVPLLGNVVENGLQ
jgi:hypothetical protein